jgi:hypothetical protein
MDKLCLLAYQPFLCEAPYLESIRFAVKPQSALARSVIEGVGALTLQSNHRYRDQAH